MAKFFNNVIVNVNILGHTNIEQNGLGNSTTTKEVSVLSNNHNDKHKDKHKPPKKHKKK